MNLKSLNISPNWTLFLDRDGVINHRLTGDYVKSWDELRFLDGVLDAIRVFSETFGNIVIVTNQQGIGKGLMAEETLLEIHRKMVKEISEAGGRIDKVYFCPDLKSAGSFYRKPQVGMGIQAKKDYPNIKFKNSIMAGDTESDMKFGKRLKMKTVLINDDFAVARANPALVDFRFNSLIDFANSL
ncbi:MAG: phosphatase [Bacteroidetes bacterium 4572_114]|nr:MAG: phosphatase [Bacteroidetes bacterium 4572_114]